MQILFLVILGAVQGLTEFLPVSSSGHLVLLGKWFGVQETLFVSIILHLATFFSVLVCLRKEIWQLIKHPFSDEAVKLYLATIPTCIIALILMPLINKSFMGGALGYCFIISAVVLFATDILSKKKMKVREDITLKHAIIMGVFQGLATFPGVSRSGATICGGILSGADKKKTAKFSFLMSLPIILLSLLMEIYEIVGAGQTISVNIAGLIISFFVAFAVGTLSIKVMLKVTEKTNFRWFALYLIIIAILSFIF